MHTKNTYIQRRGLSPLSRTGCSVHDVEYGTTTSYGKRSGARGGSGDGWNKSELWVGEVGEAREPSQGVGSVLCMTRNPASPEASPPVVGELLPRAAEAFGVRYKLETYSLDVTHKRGGPKARGFERILGITIDAIDYLEAQILARILDTPIHEVRDNAPYGIKCTVDIQVSGIGAKSDRVVNVRTVWAFDRPDAPPRLANAYPKP